MSHGVPRLQPSAQSRTDEALEAERKEILKYQTLVSDVNHAVATDPDADSTFDLTSKLLARNPEYYTIWNHRRRLLTRLFARPLGTTGPEATHKSITDDLSFLLPLLVSYPKCYWIWNHRLWLLNAASSHLPQATAQGIWAAELGLVGKMLQRDGRNFHGWDYRRVVVKRLLQAEGQEEGGLRLREDEFKYTTRMIKNNLSNFSAWHYRSQLIPELLDSRGAEAADRRALFDKELEFVKDALIDPYDQSLWFYHQHLVALLLAKDHAKEHWTPWVSFTNHDRHAILKVEISEVKEMLEDPNTHDCKWIYQSLLEYVRMYQKLESAATQLVTTIEMRSWLKKLQELDPLRQERWEDLKHQLDL